MLFGLLKDVYFIMIPYIRYGNGTSERLDSCILTLSQIGATNVTVVLDERWDPKTRKLVTVPNFVAPEKPADPPRPQRYVALLRYKAKKDLQVQLQTHICSTPPCSDLGYWSAFSLIDGMSSRTKDATPSLEAELNEFINDDVPKGSKLPKLREPDKTLFAVLIPYTGTDKDDQKLVRCKDDLERAGATKIVKVFQKRWDMKTNQTTDEPLPGTHRYVGIYQYHSGTDLSGAVSTFVCTDDPNDAKEKAKAALGKALMADAASSAANAITGGYLAGAIIDGTAAGMNASQSEASLCEVGKQNGYWSYILSIDGYNGLIPDDPPESGKNLQPTDADLTLTANLNITNSLQTLAGGKSDENASRVKTGLSTAIIPYPLQSRSGGGSPRRRHRRSEKKSRKRSKKVLWRSRRRTPKSKKKLSRRRSKSRRRRQRSYRH